MYLKSEVFSTFSDLLTLSLHQGQFEENVKAWNKQKLSRVLTQRTKSRSIAAGAFPLSNITYSDTQ